MLVFVPNMYNCDTALTCQLLSEHASNHGFFGATHNLHDSVSQRILVLEKPATNVVAHGTGVMVQLKVHLVLGALLGLGLAEALVLAKMVVVQHGGEGLVVGLGEHALLLKDGQHTHGLKVQGGEGSR